VLANFWLNNLPKHSFNQYTMNPYTTNSFVPQWRTNSLYWESSRANLTERPYQIVRKYIHLHTLDGEYERCTGFKTTPTGTVYFELPLPREGRRLIPYWQEFGLSWNPYYYRTYHKFGTDSFFLLGEAPDLYCGASGYKTPEVSYTIGRYQNYHVPCRRRINANPGVFPTYPLACFCCNHIKPLWIPAGYYRTPGFLTSEAAQLIV
jgi:hypothetical protein